MKTITDYEIMSRAIEQASSNGWDYGGPMTVSYKLLEKMEWKQIVYPKDAKEPLRVVFLPDIIYDHGFARAFWGEKVDILNQEVDDYGRIRRTEKAPRWQWRIQQQVISKDPLRYLAEGLK